MTDQAHPETVLLCRSCDNYLGECAPDCTAVKRGVSPTMRRILLGYAVTAAGIAAFLFTVWNTPTP